MSSHSRSQTFSLPTVQNFICMCVITHAYVYMCASTRIVQLYIDIWCCYLKSQAQVQMEQNMFQRNYSKVLLRKLVSYSRHLTIKERRSKGFPWKFSVHLYHMVCVWFLAFFTALFLPYQRKSFHTCFGTVNRIWEGEIWKRIHTNKEHK